MSKVDAKSEEIKETEKPFKEITVTLTAEQTVLIADLCDLGLKTRGMQIMRAVADLSDTMKKALEAQK